MTEQTRPCEVCGAPIDPERIEALPETRLCIEHGKQIARFGGEFLLVGSQSSLGKDGSMKKNYGDVSVRQKRNTEGVRKLIEEYDRKPPT
ncbi:MAG TPA: TraR/DksA C4-type zinc finger protein [Urbifossiella sp.]|nr:TraR/DksA C4-type zinc finger protein [Urbifossiella sp.]